MVLILGLQTLLSGSWNLDETHAATLKGNARK